MNPPIKDLLKPDILRHEDGWVEIRFCARREFMIGGDVVQGGMVGAMLDMAMALSDPRGLSTASLKYDILRPVVGPDLFVTGRITKRGRRIVFAEAEMRNQAGQLLARGTQTAVPSDRSSRGR